MSALGLALGVQVAVNSALILLLWRRRKTKAPVEIIQDIPAAHPHQPSAPVPTQQARKHGEVIWG